MILILCVVLVVQIIGFLKFNLNLYEMSLEHSMQQVEELSVYVEKNLQLELERYIHVLEVAELELEKEETMFSEGMIDKLKNIYSISNFKVMGLSDLNGVGVDSTGASHNISYVHIREHILQDEVYISNVLKNGNETLIFIAVPLKYQGEIRGILWGKYGLEDLVEHIEFTDDGAKYVQIIDDKGNYLLSAQSPFAEEREPFFSQGTIWEELDGFEYPEGMSAEEIREKVQDGESGNFYCQEGDQGSYVSYRPLKINNWYLFSVQMEDALHAYVYRTRQIAGHFFVVLTVGLLTIFGSIYHLIYTMYKKISRQNREISTINAMFQASLQQTRNIPFAVDWKSKQVLFYSGPAMDRIRSYSFAEMKPERLVERGLLDAGSLEVYRKFYYQVFLQEKQCDPVILYSRIGEKWEWVRVSIISDRQEDNDQRIGVLEDYGEHREKDRQIKHHLDDIKKIEKKSQIDFLTGLYNREAFLEKVSAALAENTDQQEPAALLILDLDHFKEINDRMGHAMGDGVLQKTASILQTFFRKEDLVGRLGGDEFVIFVRRIGDVPAFARRIGELNHLLCRTYRKNGESVQTSASIGIVLTDEDHTAFSALYERADQAMYQVKEGGRNGYRFYSQEKSM